ncbi:hypothetical protein AVEN_250430-1 [Araneus ventricosus]|uniref:Uncharacterized protein n=1 Tax=Araneus ventricosus TaxID=182803 RepID=A0A4Y2EE44_ARAVE|nr:hypothetical protein AVEN_250430-1 [Araneus ventricosus]
MTCKIPPTAITSINVTSIPIPQKFLKISSPTERSFIKQQKVQSPGPSKKAAPKAPVPDQSFGTLSLMKSSQKNDHLSFTSKHLQTTLFSS